MTYTSMRVLLKRKSIKVATIIAVSVCLAGYYTIRTGGGLASDRDVNHNVRLALSSESITDSDWLKRRQFLQSKGLPKKVLLFCYMRGGSTFLTSIFTQDPSMFGYYEPYAAFYTSLLGLQLWRLPLNILTEKQSDGSYKIRKIPAWEQYEITNYNHDLLNCNADKLPLEWYISYARKCTRNPSDDKTCREALPLECNERQVLAKASVAIENNCYTLMKELRSGIYGKAYGAGSVGDNPYRQCLSSNLSDTESCMAVRGAKCRSKSLITYKGLRLLMSSVEDMLQKDPDMYVIYLVRDPRSIVSSRKIVGFTFNKTEYEGKYLCMKMEDDYQNFQRLRSTYPGAFSMVRYEDIMKDPLGSVNALYSFLGLKMPAVVAQWVTEYSNNTSAKYAAIIGDLASVAPMNRWRQVLNEQEVKNAERDCEKVLNILRYN